MIILSDTKFLLPVPKREWMPSSQAIPKDELGNQDTTVFQITGRLNDGHVAWRGQFEDRGDADAFLWAIANGRLHKEPALWRLCTPEWNPDLGDHLVYEFATVTYLTTAGSLLTYTRPTDWNNSNNSVELIAGGAGGGRGNPGTAGKGGQGGGAYSKSSNITIGSTASYQVGIGGPRNNTAGNAGTSGGDSWFNGTSLGAASVSAQGAAAVNTQAGGTGGQAASGIGSIKYNGGNGGNGQSTNGAGGGGGGAGGYTGAGANGTNGASGNGGNGGNGSAGSGGAGATAQGGVGGNGNEWSGFGAGGGGGGGAGTPGAGGAGGNYGGGGGGGGTSSGGSAGGGNGIQGLIRIVYEPYVAPRVGGNMPMLGM